MSNPVFDGSWSPRHLAMTDDGMYMFSLTVGQLYAFVRDSESGEFAYRAGAEENRDTLDRGHLSGHLHSLWWSPLNETAFALTWCGASYSFALPDAGTTLDVRRFGEIGFSGSRSCGDPPVEGDRDGRHLYAIEKAANRLLVFRVNSRASLTHEQTLANNGVPGIVRPVDLALAPGSNPDENAALMQPFLDDRLLLQRRMKLAMSRGDFRRRRAADAA